jgi:tetratricopeptide (TPR) repeat protein
MSDPYRYQRFVRLLLAVFVIAAAGAPVNADDQALRDKVRNKILLAQNYLESRTATEVSASGSVVARALITRARELVEKAISDLDQGLLEPAQKNVDQSLKLFSAAAASNTRRKQSHQKDLIEIESTRAEIDAYLESYRAALSDKTPDAGQALDQDQVEGLISSAEQSRSDGDIQSAKNALNQARQLVVAALVEIRDQETVVYTVEFETPADEFRYEQERYREYVALGEKVLASEEVDQSRKLIFQQLSDGGKQLSSEAVAWAEEGDYDSAINRMQVAIKKMVQGLQLLGLPLSIQ